MSSVELLSRFGALGCESEKIGMPSKWLSVLLLAVTLLFTTDGRRRINIQDPERMDAGAHPRHLCCHI
jgi:hypothetical protein